MEKFYGKHRGMVLNNIDPLQKARLLVQVPDVLGEGTSSWAMPCLPMTGIQMGVHLIPIVGSGVWVEFEGGNADYPIWTGGFWGSAGEVPSLAMMGVPGIPNLIFQSAGQTSIMISDLPGPTGGIVLTSALGLSSITINDTGIYIKSGGSDITLYSSGQVLINQGALAVT